MPHNKLEKERSASGMRQSLVPTNSARKFIIVPASTATTAPTSGISSSAVNIPPVTAISSDPPPPVTGPRSGSLAVETQNHTSNDDAANLSMGRSLKFHSMRSVRGELPVSIILIRSTLIFNAAGSFSPSRQVQWVSKYDPNGAYSRF